MYQELDLIFGEDSIPAHEFFLIDEAEARLTLHGAKIRWPLPETKPVSLVPGEGDLVSYAPVSPLLQDPEWKREFRAAIQSFVDEARALSRNRQLPSFPLWSEASRLTLSYTVLCTHLLKVRHHHDELMDKHDGVLAMVFPDRGYADAYQWACGLVEESRLNVPPPPPPEPGQLPPPFDPAMIPTEAELEAFQTILDRLASIDSQALPPAEETLPETNREQEIKLAPEVQGEEPLPHTAELLLAGLEALSPGWHTAAEIASRAKLSTAPARVRETLGWMKRLKYVESGMEGYKRTEKAYPHPLPQV
jgi:hypothetical protein